MLDPNTILRILPIAALIVSGAASALGQAAGPSSQPTRLEDLAFLAGHWMGGSEGEVSEEVWTAPGGDAMMGTWRHVVSGKTKLFEFVSIRHEESGPELTLRHFEPDFVSQEEKDKPFRAKLIRHAPGAAVFEGSSARGSCA